MDKPMSAERQFGATAPETIYVERFGVYALAIQDARILVIETPAGFFLPGGGIEDGETPEEALRREVREESGLEVIDARPYATARQYVIERETGLGFNKVETFYRVEVRELPAACREIDHRPCWKPLADAIDGLREEAQAWVARSRANELTVAQERASGGCM